MQKNRSGFSMIEVLVASTIMMMMVMMLGMLFQQTSLAWRTGKQRANTYQQVRALFGAIQRDASAAIDQNSLPKSLINALGCGDQSFGDQLSFYTLTGTGFNHPDDWPEGGPPRRSITHVSYSGVTRTVKTYTPGFMDGGSPSGPIISSDPDSARVSLTGIKAFDDKGNGVTGSKFPAYITVSAGVNSQGVRSFDIGAGSGGPDRTMGKSPADIRSRDDIKTWAD